MKAKDHTQRAHALLSASGSSRWISCTPSARLEETYGTDSGPSIYAEEGTLAHELAELELLNTLKLISKKEYQEKLDKIASSDFYNPEFVDEVMKYVNYVLQEFEDAKKITSDAVILIEKKFDLGEIIEEGFGSNDAVIIADGVMKVIDLKFGKGVRVSAVNNPQLKLYAYGAFSEFEILYSITEIELCIMQPRLDNTSTWKLTVDQLLEWTENTVKPAAKLAYAGEGELAAGDWCKFCKVKSRCRELANLSMEIAKFEFKEPHLLNETEVSEILAMASLIQDFLGGVEKYALEGALAGKKWPGYKLVSGRSNRKWVDESRVAAVLIDNGYTADSFTNTKLKGIGDIEKLLTRPTFNSILSPLVIKPQGKATLVTEDDKRPALGNEQAKEDFGK